MSLKRYPEDLGNGRFGLSLTDTSLRFGEKGEGRAGFAPPGNLVGLDLENGRFRFVHLSELVSPPSDIITAPDRAWGFWGVDRVSTMVANARAWWSDSRCPPNGR